MRLSRIQLKNFKSHKNTEIDTKPITILIGPNSSGKSSVLHALLILKNSLHPQGNSTNPPITRNESIDLGNFNDIITNGDDTKTLFFGLMGKKKLKKGIFAEGSEPTEFVYEVAFQKYDIAKIVFNCRINSVQISYEYVIGKNPTCTIHSKHNGYTATGVSTQGINPRFNIKGEDNDIVNRLNDVFLNSKYTERLLENFYYVPYNRTVTNYGVTLTRGRSETQYTDPKAMSSSMISELSKEPKILDEVSHFIYEISGKSIRTRNVDLPYSSEQGVTIDFVKGAFSNALINEGTGLNQVLLMLYYLCKAPKNSIIAIDEPEIHMHPKAQSNLSKIIIDMVKRKKQQIIFTTHSEHMLYPFLASVASDKKGSLSKRDLAVHYFDLDKNSNFTKKEDLTVNEFGQLKGGLKGFWDADLETLTEFLGEDDE